MSACSVCSDPRAKEINRLLLSGRKGTDVAKEFGFVAQTMRWHRRRHLPYRNPRLPKPETVAEHLEVLQYECGRLAVLAECGEKIGPAIQALQAKRQVFELQARMAGRLDATHQRLLPPQPMAGEFEVVFQNGKPRTIEKKAAS